MTKKRSKEMLSARKIELYDKNAEILAYWRRNPVIACEDILGIKLLDAQKYMLQMTWNTQYSVWACSRNFGKSFLASIIMVLKWMLFEGQKIYIIGASGSQSQECFKKIEDIAMQRVNSIKSLKDIFAKETVKSPSCKTGFTHNPQSFTVFSHNDSGIFTLNSDPDNNRSKRASLVFFDESAFSDRELLTSGIAFATQDSSFVTSTDEDFNMDMEKLKCPTQLLFASSMNDTECLFYEKFKDYAMKMFMGDTKNYFVSSMPCDVPLSPLMDGEPHPPLLKQSQIDDEMRINREKALREYYNQPVNESSEDQMIRRATIIRNATLLLPETFNERCKDKYILALDPARSSDNSIISVMKVCHDDKIGYYGEIVNCVNLIDVGKKRKMSMKTPDQVKYLKRMILDYNGNGCPDYENIEEILIDAGAGGAGISGFADALLDEWKDKNGNPHKGFIDDTHDIYKEDSRKYPNASRKIKLINPKKYRNQMCEELIELLDLDLIKFPREYTGKGYIATSETLPNGEIDLKERKLSLEEEVALINIDAMKTEVTSIHTMKDDQGNVVKYALPKDKEKKMHDDRFYTLILLAHKLYEIRRNDNIGRKKKNNLNISQLFGFKAPNIRKI
ncbi:hypothetical protein ACYJ2U_001763 [Clostridium botulinum]